MSKATPRIRSMVTLALVSMLFASFGLAHPMAARPAEDRTTQQSEEGLRARSRQMIPAAISSAKTEGLVSYVEPRETLLGSIARRELGPNASQAALEHKRNELLATWSQSNYHGPNPLAQEKLLLNEQRALAAGSSPQVMGLDVEGTLRLLALAVEFAGTDDLSGFVHPVSVDDRTCVAERAGAKATGPLHNQIPPPGPRDNFTPWLPSYERDYYEKLIFSTEGITERIRPDLIDPEDGLPGINIAGLTMRNYYQEVSNGRVQFDGGPEGVVGWLQVPHSEAYYGADACTPDPDTGEPIPGDIADMEGLPSNPEFGFGPRQLIKDVIQTINQQDPSFPWADYDTDNDGYIDHIVLFHAGKDKSDGGGVQGYQALWAHRSQVDLTDPDYIVDDGGTANIPADDIRVAGYTLQYEDASAGVLVHEFGHDLGLPDLYDTSRLGESNVDAWDLMSLGSNTGKLIGITPSHMSAWDKWALGWTDPQVITPTTNLQSVLLGQTSNPPVGSRQAVRVNLPPTEQIYTELPQGSTQAWWSNNDQNLAQLTLTRNVALTGQTAPISISFDIDWAIEEDWDYLFVEVSTDGGNTYQSLPGYEVGSTPPLTLTVGGPDYPDPHGNLERFGGPGANAYTGISGVFVRAYHDLSAYAGQNIMLRFRYNTDEGFLERGSFIDNILISSASGTILNDPVEGNNANGWNPQVSSTGVNEPLGEGWVFSNGVQVFAKYYLLEWRNAQGFDKALLYSYHTVFSELTADGRDEFFVDHVPCNVPGLLVWVRDTRYGREPFGDQGGNNILDPDNQFTSFPSEGAKGGLLIVDSHPEPLRGPRGATITTDFGTFPYPPGDSWRGRVQSTNSAFGLQETPALRLTVGSGTALSATTILTTTEYAPLPGASTFHDALGYYPGVETLPVPVKTFQGPSDAGFLVRIKPYAFSDPDASVVVPAKAYYSPRTPDGFTGKGAETSPPSANVSTFETIYTVNEPTSGYPSDITDFIAVNVGEAGGTNVVGKQSGNPGSTNVQFGFHFKVVDQAEDGSTGLVEIYNAQYDAEAGGDASAAGADKPVTVNARFQNTGSPTAASLYSDFDESQASYIEGSATNGAVPVAATRAEVERVFRAQGAAGVLALRVAATQATAVALVPRNLVDTGTTLDFSYQLARKPGVVQFSIVNTAFVGETAVDEQSVTFGSSLYLPAITR